MAEEQDNNGDAIPMSLQSTFEADQPQNFSQLMGEVDDDGHLLKNTSGKKNNRQNDADNDDDDDDGGDDDDDARKMEATKRMKHDDDDNIHDDEDFEEDFEEEDDNNDAEIDSDSDSDGSDGSGGGGGSQHEDDVGCDIFDDADDDQFRERPRGIRASILNGSFRGTRDKTDFETPLHLWRKDETPDQLRLRRQRLYSYEFRDNFITLDDIPTWQHQLDQLEQQKQQQQQQQQQRGIQNYRNADVHGPPQQPQQPQPRCDLNAKVSVIQASVCQVELDAIVNAANQSLLGGGGVDGAIHSAAGYLLERECATFNGCPTGQTRITKGYNLPAKYVLHTVGPVGENPRLLQSCYRTCLSRVRKHGIRTVGFCMISTGIYGYPLPNATHVALQSVREWLETDDNAASIDRIVFVCFLPRELQTYIRFMSTYFPNQKIAVSDSDPATNATEATTTTTTTTTTITDTTTTSANSNSGVEN